MDGRQKKKLRSIFLELLIVFRLITNDGIFLENRRPVVRLQSSETFRFIRRPARRGEKKMV